MPWIRTLGIEEATGRLAQTYRAAIERAGRVFGIVRAMSQHPTMLDASMGLYIAIMKTDAGHLSGRQREMLATVVSRVNDCHY